MLQPNANASICVGTGGQRFAQHDTRYFSASAGGDSLGYLESFTKILAFMSSTLSTTQATATYLIFSLGDSLYAVDGLAVREILWLPELTPLQETPPHIVGVVNLRGKVLPVMDLNIRLGNTPQRCQVSDSIIVLAHEEQLIGIIVNAVFDVRPIAAGEVEPIPTYGRSAGRSALAVGQMGGTSMVGVGEACPRCVAGVAKTDAGIVMLLQLDHLIQMDPVEELGQDGKMPAGSYHLSDERRFCPDATPEERAIFQERARNLREPLGSQDFTGQIPLAVIGLNDEYFAIDLEIVREFAHVHSVVPVPCCPEHIVGQMNLRGDILTLVDIRSALQMPATELATNGNADASTASTEQVVVVEVGDMRMGVLVRRVLDVLHLDPAKVTATPAAVQALSNDYLKGTAPYGEKMLGILDLSKILTAEDWVVFEEV